GKPQLTVPIASTVAVDSGPVMRRDDLFSIPVSRVFISFGLVIREKRIEEMLDWVAAHDDVGLLIVGGQRPDDPYPAELAAQIAREGLGQRVIMTGWRDQLAVSSLLRLSDAVLVPVVRPQSSAYTAASQHGMPVVTLTHSDKPVPGVISFDALQGAEMGEALRQARADMEQASRPIAWSEIARLHVRFYRRLLAASGT
ncbi:MAG: glycosyltransferase, partial [Clostridia bacterium]